MRICHTTPSSRRYRRLADEYFETERYLDFCASRLGHIDEITFDWVNSPDFDQLLIDTVRSTYPPHEHDRFIEHFRGLLDLWNRDENTLGVSAQRVAERDDRFDSRGADGS